MIIHIGMNPAMSEEKRDNTFDDIKASQDFHSWQGNACTLPLPGGGNDPSGPGGKGDDHKR